MRAQSLVYSMALMAAAMPLTAQSHGAHGDGHEAMHGPAPTEGLRAELIQDVEQLESKFMDLARSMTGQYDWRPSEGVRSVGEVFGHVAGANFMIPGFAGVSLPESMGDGMQEAMQSARELEQSGDEERILESLEHSFMHVRHAITGIPDEELGAATEMFGRSATKRQVLTLVVTHMHEHLGQAIAYARMNGVTPPWSGGQ